MRGGKVFYLLGRLISIIGIAELIPLVVAIANQGADRAAFALSAPLTIAAGLLLSLCCRRWRQQRIRLRESFLFVSLTWFMAGIVGAVPFLLAGSFPDVASAFFESFSGFSTTGASALVDIEAMPRGILLWRSLTHWLGGAGIVLLFLSLIQKDSVDGEGGSLFRAEYSGGALAVRVAPRVKDNALAIFYVYVALTVACYLALLATGMDHFNAVNHALSTTATGGFSTLNLSVAGFQNPAAEWVIAIFLLLSSVNFALYYLFFVRRRFYKVLHDQELIYFTLVVAVATVLVTVPLLQIRPDGVAVGETIRQGFFQVAAIISTGGFTTANFDLWPSLSRFVLFLLLFVGGCAGSTAGSIKMNRWYLATVDSWRQITNVFRPNEVKKVYYNGRAVSGNILRAMTHYFYLYLLVVFAGAFLLICSGMDWIEAIVGALSAIGNIGPGIGSLGPAGNYALVPAFGKIVMCVLMIVGRLEIYTVLVLFSRKIWRK